jgi:putative FmdB family regulatory protein
MPIYAYKCGSCGHAKDVLQKISDTPLTTCPACGAEAFSKQLTAAGFQLKGSGWYVTDFRNGNTGAGSTAKTDDAKAGDAKPADAKPAEKSADSKAGDSKPAESKPAESATPPKTGTPSAAAGGRGSARASA